VKIWIIIKIYIFQSNIAILFTIMFTATCFDSKQSSSGYP